MKTQTESLEHASVRQYCKAVRVPVIGANFVSLAEQAIKENHSHIRYLEALLAMKCEERDRHAISNRNSRCATAPDENAGGVRFCSGAADLGGTDSRVGRGRIHRSQRTDRAHRRMWNRQNSFGNRIVSSRMPSETTDAAALVNELIEAKQNNQV